MLKHLKYIFLLGLFPLCLLAQESNPSRNLQGFFSSDLVLSADTTYLISYNVKIGSEANLQIPAGTKLLFNSGASITIDGGLSIEGSPKQKVNLSSENADFQGIGIIVSGKEGGNISIQHAVFDSLLIPLTFQNNWYRANVSIQHNLFQHTYTEQAAIKINTLNQLKLDTVCVFDFSYNNFTENSASIDLGSFEDDILQLSFKHNLISSNISFGFNANNPERAFTHLRYHGTGLKHQHQIRNNAFFGNYHVNGFSDEEMQEINFGVQGKADDINLGGNYFGAPSVKMQERFIHFFQNNQFPIINYQQLEKASAAIHAHCYKQTVNESVVSHNESIDFSEAEITLFFNRAISPLSAIDSIQYMEYDSLAGNMIQKKIAVKNTALSADSNRFSFQLAALDFNSENGSIILPIFQDTEGFSSPRLAMGKTLLIDLFTHDSFGQFSEITETQNNLNSILSANSNVGESRVRKPKTFRFDAGILAGKTAYIGELNMDNMPYGAGMFYRMTINNSTAFKTAINYGEVNGSSQGSDTWKNLSFSSEIIEFSLQTEINLVNFEKKKVVPSIFFGLSAFQFNPKASIVDSINGLSYTYALQPLNTENLDEAYKRTQIAIPFGIAVKKIVLDKWVVGVEFGVRKTFTDYLDDVSGFYADYDDFEDPIAAHFSDPSRVVVSDNGETYDYQKPGLRGNPYNKDWYIFMGINISSIIK